jgi:predicted nuclease of predicted toxin-antitoxin system
MRFLADESCDVALVKALRDAGNDVLEVRLIKAGAYDEWVVDLALSERRVLLTADKDFAWLIYAHGQKAIGVIFLRYPVSERHGMRGFIPWRNQLRALFAIQALTPINSGGADFTGALYKSKIET